MRNMNPIESHIDTTSAAFAANASSMRQLVAELEQAIQTARAGGGEKAQARHAQLNKLFVRERIDLLLDPGSPFLELGALAAMPSIT